MRHRNTDVNVNVMADADDVDSHQNVMKTSDSDVYDSKVWLSDITSMGILLVLYILQGIPMGLSGSIPLLLKEKGVSYEGLSLFSLVSLPFSFKIIWAPIVDSVFLKKVGRRKSWLIPVQLVCGVIMIFSTSLMTEWMGEIKHEGNPDNHLNVEWLTAFFMFLYFLMATQDIAVDGWALTMLSRRNVGYGSICNTIGQAFGVFLANQGLISLSDSKWCHTFLGMESGKTLVTLSSFMRFWGIVFIITTLILWLFKSETPIADEEEPDGLVATYRHVIAIFKSPKIQILSIILLTRKISSAPTDSASVFKMQEYGLPKSDIATISPIIMVVQFLLPALMSSYASSKPLNCMIYGCALQLPASIISWAVVQMVPAAYSNNQTPSLTFFAALIASSVINQIVSTMGTIGMISFFAKIADPTIGGTYMTLLTTLSNLGWLWTSSASLWILPKLSLSTCLSVKTSLPVLFDNSSSVASAICTASLQDKCKANGGRCQESRDSFTILVFGCVIIGIGWLSIFSRVLLKLQDHPHDDWRVTSSSGKAKDDPKFSGKHS